MKCNDKDRNDDLGACRNDDLGAWQVLAHLLEMHEVTPARASDELWRVHEIEAARLLREAAVLRARMTLLGELFVAESHRLTEERWRSRASRELALARLDGVLVDELLSRLAASSVDHWPPAIVIARGALALVEGLEGRMCLHIVRVGDGDFLGARQSLEILIASDPVDSARTRGCAMAALAAQAAALAAQAEGAHERALVHFESAAAAPRSGLDPLVSSFALALRCADEPRARAALRRLLVLDFRVDGMRVRWERALERTHARAEWEHAQGRKILTRDGARLARELARAAPRIATPVIDALS